MGRSAVKSNSSLSMDQSYAANGALLVMRQQVLHGISFYRIATVSTLQSGSKYNALDAPS